MKLVTIHHVIENRHYINCYYIIYQKISLKFIFFIASILSIRLIPTRTSPRNPSFPIILISILKHPINHCRQLKNECGRIRIGNVKRGIAQYMEYQVQKMLNLFISKHQQIITLFIMGI